MPVIPTIPTTRLSQKEFGDLAYDVTGQVIAVHRDFGRLFDELVYKREVAARRSDALLEVGVDLIHGTFTKRLFADVIVRGGALFEFKSAEALHSRHRSQTIQYLLLFGLAHAKLFNVRNESLEHEFVNCTTTRQERQNFTVDDREFASETAGAVRFKESLISVLRDWGTGLEVATYEEAVIHLLGGEDAVVCNVPVLGTAGHIADQRMRLAVPNAAFKITSLAQGEESLTAHARRILAHTPLDFIHWANIHQNTVRFTTLRK